MRNTAIFDLKVSAPVPKRICRFGAPRQRRSSVAFCRKVGPRCRVSDRTVAVATIAFVLLAAAYAPATAAGAEGQTLPDSTNATLLEAFPNPVADGDPGEFVVVRFADPTNTSDWTLTDGKTTAGLSNRTHNGTVVFSSTPAHARNHTERPVEPLDGRLLLADSGDRLELVAGNTTVSTGQYHNAPAGRRRNFVDDTWEPIGATDYTASRFDEVPATAFVLPDAPDQTIEHLEDAEERILIGGYTFTSKRITDTLLEAVRNGVQVRLILDGEPVGGIVQRQANQLDKLVDAGVEVRLFTGPSRRYDFHHAKYAVVDDEALVATENFKPAGTGGMSSRGWGVVIEDGAVADELATIHERDRTWRAAKQWQRYRNGRDFSHGESALGSFEAQYEPASVDVETATVLVAPDNAGPELESTIDAASDRVLVQQMRIDSRDNNLLQATIRAAARGVRVRILLDGSWYVEEDNSALVEWLNRRAAAEGWDLEAKIDEPDGYTKIHTKGLVVDDTAVVGSLNWVRSAQSRNREVVVALEGPEAATYYATVFQGDWGAADRPAMPAGLFAAVAVSGSGALLVIRRIEFVGRQQTVSEWQW